MWDTTQGCLTVRVTQVSKLMLFFGTRADQEDGCGLRVYTGILQRWFNVDEKRKAQSVFWSYQKHLFPDLNLKSFLTMQIKLQGDWLHALQISNLAIRQAHPGVHQPLIEASQPLVPLQCLQVSSLFIQIAAFALTL